LFPFEQPRPAYRSCPRRREPELQRDGRYRHWCSGRSDEIRLKCLKRLAARM